MRFDSPGPLLLRLWARLAPLPGGRRLFAWLVGRVIPYTGSIAARVDALASGSATVRLRERRRVRNHLASIHAVALVNLGEFASGLAITTALPRGVRGIPIRLDTEFLRKARGEVVASARCVLPPFEAANGEARSTERPAPPSPLERDVALQVPIRDRSGETVARVTATWRLRAPAPGESGSA